MANTFDLIKTPNSTIPYDIFQDPRASDGRFGVALQKYPHKSQCKLCNVSSDLYYCEIYSNNFSEIKDRVFQCQLFDFENDIVDEVLDRVPSLGPDGAYCGTCIGAFGITPGPCGNFRKYRVFKFGKEKHYQVCNFDKKYQNKSCDLCRSKKLCLAYGVYVNKELSNDEITFRNDRPFYGYGFACWSCILKTSHFV